MPSTVISKFEYDVALERLRVTFISGLIYDYLKVPVSVYEEMKSSFSKGIFLNTHIKGTYEYLKIKG